MKPIRLITAMFWAVTLRCERLDRLRATKPREEWEAAERFGERLHTSMCRSCRRARRKLDRLDEGLRTLGDSAAGSMPDGTRERLRRGLAESS